MPLGPEDLRKLEIIERTASALSGVGVLTIIAVFTFSSSFRNPMHRLIFINAFYNAFDVVLTMISVSGPAAGDTAPLCQFQAFLNQMFPLADVFWTLAMACDVFMIVYQRLDAQDLRKYESRYLVGITAVTFVPAFVFLFVRTEERGAMYGSVTLWCAVSHKWALVRIVGYYVPIWLSILITMVLYILVGREILKRRSALKAISKDSIPLDADIDTRHFAVGDVAPDIDNYYIQSECGGSIGVASTTDSVVRLRPDAPVAHFETHAYPERASLSFRQYVLMPLFFFIVLLAVWVAPSTNRVAQFIDPSYQSTPLLLAVGATGSLRGFWNAVVFLTLGFKAHKRSRRGTGEPD